MANFTISPNMQLTVPVVSVDPGPDWAENLNISLGSIDQHDHSSGKGVLVTPSGLNINADVPLNQNNLTLARSLRLFANTSTLSLTADLGCLYRFGPDLYFNDGSGNTVRITQSGSVAGSAGTITGLPSGTASAAFVSISGSFVFQQSTSSAGNIDAGTLLIRYPGSYPTPSGNYIAIQAPSSLASGYAYTLPATLPAAISFPTIGTDGAWVYTQIDNSTLEIASATTLRVRSAGITGTQLAASVAGNGLSGGAGAPLAVNVDGSTIAIASDTLGVPAGGINATQITTNVNLNGKAVKQQGLNLVVGNANATNSLAILRGLVGSGGSITTPFSGEGFTVNNSAAGVYVINFSSAFADNPAVITSGNGSVGTIFSVVASITNSTITIQTATNSTMTPLANGSFSFLAIGQRA